MAKLGQIAVWFNGRRRVVAVVLIGWVALVVTGAGQKPDASGWFSVPDLQAVFAIFMGLLALCGLLLLPFMIRAQRGPLESRPKQSVRALIVITVILVALAFAIGPQDFGSDAIEGEPTSEQTAASPKDSVNDAPNDPGAVAVLLFTCAVAGAALLWSRRRLAPTLGELSDENDASLEAGLESAIDLATNHLLHGRDPRTSVLAAYGSLERSLSEQGRGRDPSETPTEHLERVLVGIPVVAVPAVQLGELYELARFSDHPITQDDQQLAALALERSRRELAELLSTAP